MNGFNQNVDLDVGGMLSKSWEIFQRDMVNWVLIGIVGSLALGVGGWGGFQYCGLKAARGESVSVSDVFYPFQHFGRMIVPIFAIIALVIVTCGLGALPAGFLLMWMYSLMVDRGLGFVDAAKLSKDAAMANVGPTLITLVVIFALNMLGSAVMIGALVTTPIAMIFGVLAYLNIFGSAPAGGGPSPQSLDYSPNAPAPMGVPAGGYAPPAAAPPMAQGGGFAPPAAAPVAAAPFAAPAPAPAAPAPAPYGAPAPAPAAPAPAPFAAPAPAAAAVPPTADGVVETAQQATTNNPDEIVAGRTIAMNTMDFEKMLKEQGNK